MQQPVGQIVAALFMQSQWVTVIAPFGDGTTAQEVMDVAGVAADGTIVGPENAQAVTYYQYLIGDSWFAEKFLRAV